MRIRADLVKREEAYFLGKYERHVLSGTTLCHPGMGRVGAAP
jgi:hypothetical protein